MAAGGEREEGDFFLVGRSNVGDVFSVELRSGDFAMKWLNASREFENKNEKITCQGSWQFQSRSLYNVRARKVQ